MYASPLPCVSVVLPVYNDPSGLRATLESLVAQTYPSYEVIVVDNDSDDGRTLAVARSFAESEPDLVRLDRERAIQSSYAARNRGIRVANGEIFAFIDADVTVSPDWIAAGVSTMQERDVEYLGCHIDITREESTITGLYNALTGFPVERYIESNRFAPTCGLFVRRAVLEAVGGFDQHLISGGDVEFGQRVAAAGYDLHYSPTVRVEHPARTSLRSLLEKRLRIGRGITQRRRRYPDRYEPAPLYHPVGLLPPHPLRFGDHVGEGFSWSEKLGLYGVSFLERLAETGGRVMETVVGQTEDTPPDRPSVASAEQSEKTPI